MKKAWKYLVVLFTAIILYYFMLPDSAGGISDSVIA